MKSDLLHLIAKECARAGEHDSEPEPYRTDEGCLSCGSEVIEDYCRQCDGTGERSDGIECEECGGTGLAEYCTNAKCERNQP